MVRIEMILTVLRIKIEQMKKRFKFCIKYNLLIVIALIICSAFVIQAYAHSGRTDAYGGHWDRSTGTYHYHSGGYSKSNNLYVSDYPTVSPTLEPVGTESLHLTESEKSVESNSDVKYSFGDWVLIIVINGLWIIPILVGIFTSLCESIVNHFNPYNPKYKLNQLENEIDYCVKLYNALAVTYVGLMGLQKQLNILQKGKYKIGDDGLPKEKSSKGWGKDFTLYATNTGSKLHTRYGCSGAGTPVHICLYYEKDNFSELMCDKCGKDYEIPDLRLYEIYLLFNSEKKEFENLKECLKSAQVDVNQYCLKCRKPSFKFLMKFSKKNQFRFRTISKKYTEMRQILKTDLKTVYHEIQNYQKEKTNERA